MVFMPNLRQKFSPSGIRLELWLGLVGYLFVSGCSTLYDTGSAAKSSVYDAVNNLDLGARKPLPIAENSSFDGGIRLHSETYLATDDMAAEAGKGQSAAAPDGDEARFDIDMQATPIEAAARSIFGEILKLPYSVDPRVQGGVTLASGRPVPRKALIASFEASLQAVGAALVKDQNGYRIIPLGDAIGQGGVSNANANEPGYGITILPLAYVSADTMLRLLDGFAAKPGMVRAMPNRNLLVIQGSGSDRQGVVDSAFAFDQDWMKGQSVGVYSLANSAPEAVISELRHIFEAGDGGANSGLIQFQPMARMNGILVIAKRADLLKRVATWVTRLDKADSSATAARVYRVKYGDAKQLAAILNDSFGAGGNASYSVDTVRGSSGGLDSQGGSNTIASVNAGGQTSNGATMSGGMNPQQAQPAGVFGASQPSGQSGNFSSAEPDSNTPGAQVSPTLASGGGQREGNARVRITADSTTNSLLIFADQETSSMIFKVIEQIDRPRLQVAIEATIAEVTLNNSLQYGVQYYLKNNVGSIGLATSKAASGAPNTTPLVKTLPGFNLLLGSEADPKAILTALSGRTNVKVLSTPSLVVLDNQVATLQVGDQVPVSTTQATLVSGGATDGFPVANNIDYRNTGVILRVLPRVAANGNVTLDVDQEISNVANPSNASTLTPTISQRRVKSSIAVSSGQTVLLAGLISDREQAGRDGIPFLERITLLGDLFATNMSTVNRTELIIFIKPQIIRDAVDAQAVAEEMRSKMTAKPSAN